MIQPSISPKGVDEILYGPGERKTTVQLSGFTDQARLTAETSLTSNEGLKLRVASMTTVRFVEKEIYIDVIPGEVPEGLENETETEAVTVWEEEVVRTVQGGGPIDVGRSEAVKVDVSIEVTDPRFRRGTGVLMITSGVFERPIAVPLVFQSGSLVDFSVAPGELGEEQGGVVSVTISASHRSGPGAEVTYELIGDAEADRITMEPAAVRLKLEPGDSKKAIAAFRIPRDCAPEGHTLRILQRGAFPADGWHERTVTLHVRPAPPPAPRPTLSLETARDSIQQEYLRHGGPSGRLGYPTSPVKMSPFGGLATRYYRGGRIEATLRDGPIGVVTQAIVTFKVVVSFLGFRCIRESDHDQLTPTDEPYFILAIDNATGNPIVQKIGPFENIETGSEIGVGQIFKIDNLTPNPLSIRVIAYENDQGDPSETARKLQEKMVELARAVQSLAGAAGADAADGPGIGPTAAASVVGAFAGPLGALLAAGIVQILDLGDDYIGQGAQLLYARTELAGSDPPRQGSFQGQDYNVMIEINGREEGHYQLFFDVDGRTINEQS
ncbi:hypothetical protein [Rhizobium sp. BK251]|uniref:hypothetical protein n=1 Tax=Rhizobium sp. BK251 TaxID=2512125 RepID=UPI001043AF61|nr:hypothetical protein [Rhizobium sp. BK251]TCL63654.1 hypothetical protein EV286_11651 [Rhizobium sp. BK251]